MSRLILVRHAQASFGRADYDQLSPVGEEQARRLGAHWAGLGSVIDQVFIGPRLRHRRTAELVGAAFSQAGLPWPEAVALPELDEYAGLDVFQASLPQLTKSGFDPATLAAGLHPPAASSTELLTGLRGLDVSPRLESAECFDPVSRDDPGCAGGFAEARADSSGNVVPYDACAEDRKSGRARIREVGLKKFQDTLLLWVRGELTVPGVETWKEFRIRARRGLEKMVEGTAHGLRILAFTSTGPVAAAVDRAFNLDDERMLEVSWQLRNTAVSEFVFSNPRFSLNTFNALPHLAAPELITLI